MSKTALIIGGGPAGCAASHQLTLLGGWDITLTEQGPYLGAGARTFFHGGHPYTFGPRHFLTQNEKVYNYLNSYLLLRGCANHEFWTYVEQDQNFYNFPIHTDDIERMPDCFHIKYELECEGYDHPPINLEEYWRNSVGSTLYNKFIRKYSKKMWGVEATELDTFSWSPKGVTLKSGPRAAWDNAISAYPYDYEGYNTWFDIATAGASVLLNTKTRVYDLLQRRVWIGNNIGFNTFDIIISTISPDIPFGPLYGALPYIGRDFHKIVLPVEFALPENVYFMYNAGDEAWTRTTEFKKFTQHKSDQTLLGIEIPSKNGKYYPMPIKKWQRLAEQYFQTMGPGVFCMGRSGCYRYGLDIAACIEQAMELVEILKQGGQDHPVIGEKWRTI
jgi:UDP-galactopyranose mutase